jgi:hypothetical protein
MNEPTNEPHIDELRGLLTQTLHGVCEDASLIDCARLSNFVFDEAQEGDYSSVKAILCLLKAILNDGRTVNLDMIKAGLVLIKIHACEAEQPTEVPS